MPCLEKTKVNFSLFLCPDILPKSHQLIIYQQIFNFEMNLHLIP